MFAVSLWALSCSKRWYEHHSTLSRKLECLATRELRARGKQARNFVEMQHMIEKFLHIIRVHV